MVTDVTPGGNPGVYDQRDNQLITGDIEGAGGLPGMDFGAGPVQPDGEFHMLSKYELADPLYSVDPVDTDNTTFQGTFTRFIWDQRGRPRNNPHRPDSYLLISAGADAVFGTSDDVANFERE